MPREIVTVQVGQCGNQIGRCFWQQALTEHASVASNRGILFDDCMSTFFRNVNSRTQRDLPAGSPLASLKARAVLIDMEDGVVNETLNGPLGDLFSQKQLVTDVYGAGNNWAHGYASYGPQYKDALLEAVRGAVEHCDSIQAFQLLHSMGGGTGSGLGTFMLSLLEDIYPSVLRMVTAVFPSKDDDVVTSPYNSVLALKHLTDHADCVIPVDNYSLLNISKAMENSNNLSRAKSTDARTNSEANLKSGFDEMNSIVADVLTDMTASARFQGSLNVDVNEIYTNLVPFPRLHYLISSMAPLRIRKKPSKHVIVDDTNRLFTESLSSSRQLMHCNPAAYRYLACSFFIRGNVTISEANSGLRKIRDSIEMIPWNRDGFKLGLCNVPPPGIHRSILSLSNNCCIADNFDSMKKRFCKLYDRRAMVHHYAQFIHQDVFDEALESISGLIEEYKLLNSSQCSNERAWPMPAF